MKFLSPAFDNKLIMPLQVYYDKGQDGRWNDDFIDIVFKDMETGKRHVCTIRNPVIEIWITKPEYRTYDHIRDYYPMEKCDKVKVHYKTRYSEVGRILGCTSQEAKVSPYVFQMDMAIEHFYLLQFILEYGNDKAKKLSLGFFDIENDIILGNDIKDYGSSHITCITFVEVETRQVYFLYHPKNEAKGILEKNYPMSNKMLEMYQDYSVSYDANMGYFDEHIGDFIQECHDTFDEDYGMFTYNVFKFDQEIDMIQAIFKIMKASDCDFISAWNAPYDIQNLIERPRTLGYDPNTIIQDYDEFKEDIERRIVFVEDTNYKAHKRKHVCKTYTLQSFVDYMQIYAGIRAARGELPSLKLNYIAERELKDKKLDYSEEADLTALYYHNPWKYHLYNIKDVLLLVKLALKTRDFDTYYSLMYENALLQNEAFVSTVVVLNSLRIFAATFNKGYVMGSNKSKLFKDKKETDARKVVDAYIRALENRGDKLDEEDPDEPEIEEDDEVDEDAFFDDSANEKDILIEVDDDDDPEPSNGKKKKKKKYQGAFVMNPLHMKTSGFKIMGAASQLIHDFVIDMDIKSEYPTAYIIQNASNETFVGKVFLDPEEEKNIVLPIFKEFNFIGKEQKAYKVDISNHMMETYSTGDKLNFGHIYLNLPSPSEVLEDIGKNIEMFIKKG